VKGGRGTATRTVGLLGSILSYAMSEGHCPANAAHGVKTFAQGKRRMALEPAQYRAALAHAITIRRAAEILGEDEELLWDLATDMEPEHGRLWIYDAGDQQTVAFTSDGMEYLREMLQEYKRNRSSLRP
jgi:hypothetical protein